MKSDEKVVEAFFRERGFEPAHYAKNAMRHGKTPDFKIMREGRLCFFCEVKTIKRDEWAEELGTRDEWVGDVRRALGVRSDPRLTADIHTAVQQFDAVNADQHHPNVLAFVNHDGRCGSSDLFSVFTGFALADDGSTVLVFPQFSEGRIKDEKLRIHLFLWFEEGREPKFRFTETKHDLHTELCGLFGVAAQHGGSTLNSETHCLIVIDRLRASLSSAPISTSVASHLSPETGFRSQ